MDSFEFNKIAGAVLASVLVIIGVQHLAEIIYHTEDANPLTYPVEVADAGHGGEAVEKPVEVVIPFTQLLASADASKGAKVFKKCASCHTLPEGGNNGTGPNLFGVVGRDVGSASGFSYSQPMATLGGTWTFDRLNEFLTKPKAYLPGTKMGFAGIKKPQQRADLVAFLNQNGSNLPVPAANEAVAPVVEAGETVEMPAVETDAMEAAH